MNELTKKRGIKKDGQEFNELDVREEESRLNGKPMEIIMITSDYLDNWQYHVEIQTETFYQSKKALDKALAIEKITTVAQLFPDIFMPNKKEFFKDLMMKYDDNPDKYLRNLGEQNPLMALAQGQEQALGDGQNVPVTEQMNRPEQSLARLSGAETI